MPTISQPNSGLAAYRPGSLTWQRAVVLALAWTALAATLLTAGVRAHAELERAEPPPDGLLAAPPRRIELWMTERVAEGAGSPSLRVLDEAGRDLTVRRLRLDPNNPRHILAEIEGVGPGTYTVVWSARSADDGHLLSGTYAFRVATGRAPGAATVEGELPRPWAVVTRWLTFLGAAAAAAGLLFGRLITVAEAATAIARRRTNAIVAAAGVALLATLAEPVLLSWFPTAGVERSSLGDAVAGLPGAWWLRPPALAVVLVLGRVLLAMRGRDQRVALAEWAGAVAALVALAGLALTSHVAASDTWRPLGTASIVLHQWTVGLWVGGLLHLALTWPGGRALSKPAAGSPPAPDPVRRFSRYALGLALVGIGTGVINAGLVLPTVRSLWNSDYGQFLLAKIAILAPVLGLAAFHRRSLRRMVSRVGTALRSTVRVEAALALVVVLGGSVLALTAPPAVVRGELTVVDLAAPLGAGAQDGDVVVRLLVTPARAGENRVTVRLGRWQPDRTFRPLDGVTLVRLDFISLDHDAEQIGIGAEPDGEGGFTSRGVQLSLDGWWRVEVIIRRPGVADVTVPFYLRLPDPNLNGFEAVPTPQSSDEAELVFQRGLAGLTSLRSVRWTQRLSGGTGTVVVSEHLVREGSGEQPPASAILSDELELIIVGDRRWQRRPGGEWLESEAAPVSTPSTWGDVYEGAIGFHLGRLEEIDGEPAQIVSFFVPGTPRLAPAWYAWWVGTESGRVLRETMVSRYHYMVYRFTEFNQPMPIEPPIAAGAAAPAATPGTAER